MGIRSFAAACMLALLTACRQPTTGEVAQIVQGSTNVKIESLQILPVSDTSPDTKGSPIFYVCKVLFTNSFHSDLTPAIDHFVFTTVMPRESYHALTSGMPDGVAATSSPGVLSAGGAQEYTLVFRPTTGAIGTVAYQP